MNKRRVIQFSLLGVLLAVALVGIAYSQTPPAGTSMPSSGSTPNPGHASEQVLCNGCVQSSNILDSSITNNDIANNANINMRKVIGVNGVMFNSAVPSAANTWAIATNVDIHTLVSDWNGVKVEMLCDNTLDGILRTHAGVTQPGGSIFKWNHNVGTLSGSNGPIIYRVETASGSIQVEMKACGSTIECNTGSQIHTRLMLRKVTTGTVPESVSAVECQLKVLSYCNGASTCV